MAAAVEKQRSIAIHEWPEAERLRLRVGIHTGEVAEMSTGPVGYEVHRAARIAAVGHGGQVLLSSAVAGLLVDTPPPEESLRDHEIEKASRREAFFDLGTLLENSLCGNERERQLGRRGAGASCLSATHAFGAVVLGSQ